MRLTPCPHCPSFLAPAAGTCPGCGATVKSASLYRRLPAPVRGLLALGGGGLLSVTLSACYGAPCSGGACYEPDSGGPPTDSGTDSGLVIGDAGDEDAGEAADAGGDAGGDDAGADDAGADDAGADDAGADDAGAGDDAGA